MFLSLPSYRLLQAPLPCASEDVPRPTDNASSSLWPLPSSVSLHVVGRHEVSQDTRLAAPARQLVCFLVLLCACESSPGAWVTAPRRWNERGVIFLPSPCPSHPNLVCRDGQMVTKGFFAAQAFRVSFPHEENGSHSTRACYCHPGPAAA